MYHPGMTATIARAKLSTASTATLIEQYCLAISSHAGRNTERAPRQNRINYIVDLISDRADAGDTVALTWLEA